MIFSQFIEWLKDLYFEQPQYFYGVFAAFGLIFSNFIISPENGLYMGFQLIVLVTEVTIGFLFLLFNASSLFLAIFMSDGEKKNGLNEIERKWISSKIRKNVIIILLWIASTFITFFLVKPYLGVVSGIYLIGLMIIFKQAGKEENPFIEQRYDFRR